MANTVKCPYCGEEHGDLWDHSWGNDEYAEIAHTCDSCEKDFVIIRTVSISYSTRPDPDFEKYLDSHPLIRERLNRMKAII